MNQDKLEYATLGGGCFWCVEAIYQLVKGVESIESGYAGGHDPSPNYKSVCSGQTGHAEVIRIGFDPNIISFESILEIFWEAHDPTTRNRQGNDEGPQYRSIILYENENQKAIFEKSRTKAQEKFKSQIVTEIVLLTKFFKAEGYHQNYFRTNPNQPYCHYVIRPKIEKFLKR
ncbi:peptide-methionine (S)-S-oxide reductase [Leptospira perolatii]|uniref:Peptide methionine sulfoxide reductase MsrA n=1 Tax=Leptospira perolatii TaxID=2023191 RepID=A0A2M9ZRY5_9LEPT|nr:peptide-methionine (S)-S-oxide reductase MsrA [Leptospira perolatii]PJZ71292.1 peptide-methionine (S)-S-oxide reductase [Leptospira perolatii]PJZ74826.1 peptide-methionine (S)-S-oxide reductase [Leptospira perolatii]